MVSFSKMSPDSDINLFLLPGVLEKLFEYFSCSQLAKFRLVCKQWDEDARVKLRRRLFVVLNDQKLVAFVTAMSPGNPLFTGFILDDVNFESVACRSLFDIWGPLMTRLIYRTQDRHKLGNGGHAINLLQNTPNLSLLNFQEPTGKLQLNLWSRLLRDENVGLVPKLKRFEILRPVGKIMIGMLSMRQFPLRVLNLRIKGVQSPILEKLLKDFAESLQIVTLAAMTEFPEITLPNMDQLRALAFHGKMKNPIFTVDNCPKLQKLHVLSTQIQLVCNQNSSVTELSFSPSQRDVFRDAAFQLNHINVHFTNLKKLKIGVNEVVLRAIFQELRQLENLDLEVSGTVNDFSFTGIEVDPFWAYLDESAYSLQTIRSKSKHTRSDHSIGNLTKLRRLTVKPVPSSDMQLTDIFVMHGLSLCPKLEIILVDSDYMCRFTDRSLKALEPLGKCLRILDLGYQSQFTTNGVESFKKSCVNCSLTCAGERDIYQGMTGNKLRYSDFSDSKNHTVP